MKPDKLNFSFEFRVLYESKKDVHKDCTTVYCLAILIK